MSKFEKTDSPQKFLVWIFPRRSQVFSVWDFHNYHYGYRKYLSLNLLPISFRYMWSLHCTISCYYRKKPHSPLLFFLGIPSCYFKRHKILYCSRRVCLHHGKHSLSAKKWQNLKKILVYRITYFTFQNNFSLSEGKKVIWTPPSFGLATCYMKYGQVFTWNLGLCKMEPAALGLKE